MIAPGALKELLDREHCRKVRAGVGFVLLAALSFGTLYWAVAICVLIGILVMVGVFNLIEVLLRVSLRPDLWTIADLKYLALTIHFPEEADKPIWLRNRQCVRESWRRFCDDPKPVNSRLASGSPPGWSSSAI
jgi:hypothetical protein